MRVVVLPDPDAVAASTAARLLVVVQDALAERGVAHVSLTGGSLGIAAVAAVADSPLAASVDWTSVHLWWSDERFVPSGHADRNEHQAQDAGIARLPIPEENVHRMGPSDRFDSAEDAAAAYAAQLAEHGDPVPAFDVSVLGLGPDGHVASLFPGHPGLQSQGVAAGVHDSPKPPPDRVTLTVDAINASRRIWIIVGGSGKADAVRWALSKEPGIPSGMVRGTEQSLMIVDAAAASKL